MCVDHRVRRKPQRLTSNDPIETARRNYSDCLSSRAGSPDRNLTFLGIYTRCCLFRFIAGAKSRFPAPHSSSRLRLLAGLLHIPKWWGSKETAVFAGEL